MLSGPALKPVEGNVEQLVVLLHGYGTNGDDLISLGHNWRHFLPQAEFIAPHAPYACENSPFFGRQWFNINNWTPQSLLIGIRQTSLQLSEFLTQSLKERGLESHQLALAGFSQGTMMALYTALHRNHPCAGVVGYSGALVCEESDIHSKPPVLLVHGQTDHVVLHEQMENAKRQLLGWGINAQGITRPNLGHGIDEEGIQAGGIFLKRVFFKENLEELVTNP